MNSGLFRKVVSPEGQKKKGKKGISTRQMVGRMDRTAKLRTEDVLFLCEEKAALRSWHLLSSVAGRALLLRLRTAAVLWTVASGRSVE